MLPGNAKGSITKRYMTSLADTKHIQLFRERLSETMCMRQSRKVIWDMINTLFLTLQLLNLLLLLSFSNRKHRSMVSCAILSNFFEEQRTQNHPQYLSGLSRAIFSATFSRNGCIHRFMGHRILQLAKTTRGQQTALARRDYKVTTVGINCAMLLCNPRFSWREIAQEMAWPTSSRSNTCLLQKLVFKYFKCKDLRQFLVNCFENIVMEANNSGFYSTYLLLSVERRESERRERHIARINRGCTEEDSSGKFMLTEF